MKVCICFGIVLLSFKFGTEVPKAIAIYQTRLTLNHAPILVLDATLTGNTELDSVIRAKIETRFLNVNIQDSVVLFSDSSVVYSSVQEDGILTRIHSSDGGHGERVLKSVVFSDSSTGNSDGFKPTENFQILLG